MSTEKASPLIFYVDDEPRNLTVFETFFPDEWQIQTFENPLEALDALNQGIVPHVIVSDQRMPGITGVKFLELAKSISPTTVRIITTGYSAEELIIDSVRKAQIFDYLTKPWDPNNIELSVHRAIEHFQMNQERDTLIRDLKERESKLSKMNREILKKEEKLENTLQELQCWVPPIVTDSFLGIKDHNYSEHKDVVGIVYDIVNSSFFHAVTVSDLSLRIAVLRAFSETVLKHGGWRESQSGDAGYAHFGVVQQLDQPFEAALAAAREFQININNISKRFNVPLACGIGLHIAHDATLDLQIVETAAFGKRAIQKCLATCSPEIDILHRMERLVHELEGTNIIMTQAFLDGLNRRPSQLERLGQYEFKRPPASHQLYLIPCESTSADQIEEFRRSLATRDLRPVASDEKLDNHEALNSATAPNGSRKRSA